MAVTRKNGKIKKPSKIKQKIWIFERAYGPDILERKVQVQINP